jgi:primosomal protein N' (replication factor Y)
MPYLEVAVASPIATTLTYAAPKLSTVRPVPGLRVLVPLGSRQLTGYVLSCPSAPPAGGYTIRSITDYLDPAPLFPAAMVPFFRWLADYYQYPIGEIIKGALPSGLTPQSGRLIVMTDKGRLAFQDLPEAEWPGPWFAKFLQEGRLSSVACRKLWRTKSRRELEKWAEAGLVDIVENVSADQVGEKKELCVRPASLVHHEVLRLKLSERKTRELIEEVMLATNKPWVAAKDLARHYPGARKALVSLAEQGLIMREERPVYRDPFGEQPPFSPIPDQLTGEQVAALAELSPAIEARRYAPFLLHGITGSGKTEVYLRATEQVLAQGRDVLILVPEIALATQLEGNFLSRFGGRVAILHSGLTGGERFDQWRRIATGQAKIVIGARSALFAPFANLGLIVVDEEHDGAYKQDDSFRYHARDAAVMRASQSGAVVILGSATPAIISYYHTTTGKYRLLSLTKRVADRSLPTVEVVDLKTVPTVSGKPPLFSPQLVAEVKSTFMSGDQSLIFLNRRGFANLLLCRECGTIVECTHCHVSLTLHQKSGRLLCHYCGFSMKSEAICAHCQSPGLTPMGFGTERIEDELQRILPDARIARLDRDTAFSREKYLAILKAVHHREIDILVGTQMITKGHHFPHVTMVGVVWADAGLGIPDYKAGERTFQLLTQVFGRAGRGEKPGKVVVQTYHPDHYSISTAQSHDYNTLYAEEIRLRKSLSFPPFSRLVNIRIEGPHLKDVEKVALHLGRLARQQGVDSHVGVLGPAPAPIAKVRDHFRWQLLLKSADLKRLHALSANLIALKPAALGVSSVKLLVDVDPESMV